MKHHSYCCCCFLIMLFVRDVINAHNIQPFDIKTTLKSIIQAWFPDEIKFNKSCLTEGCPGLNNFSLCPAEVDVNKMKSLLEIISGCMRGLICGTTIENRPIPYMKMAVGEFLPGTSIKGVAIIAPQGHLSNVSNIELELVSGQPGRLPVQMFFHTPKMRARGQMDIQMTLPLEWLTTAGQRLDIHLPNATYDASFQFYSTICLNQSSKSSPIEIEFLNPIIKARYEICGMDMPDGLPNIMQLFAQVSNDAMEKSDFATKKVKFLKKLFQCAIDVVSNNCFK